jgi:hypothetical protein
MREVSQNQIQEISKHYRKLLGVAPRRTKLETIPSEEWKNFCSRNNLDAESGGIFLPRNMAAYVNLGSNTSQLNAFHEYFGHGLFCEYSQDGRLLTKLEGRLMNDEKREFSKRIFSADELQKFRESNPNFSLLQKQRQFNGMLYELFAIWTEHYLSQVLNIDNQFKQKYDSAPKALKENIEGLLKYQKEHGELALFYESGMPRYPNKERIKKLLENFSRDWLKGVEMVLLYGSKKPYSDIDLFIVSEKTGEFSNNWIDIRTVTQKELDYKLSVFDISLTDPILTGELIIGDESELARIRAQVQQQPITQEGIYYNKIQSKEQRIYAEQYPLGSKKHRIGMGYAYTFMKNAIRLSQGKRELTKKEILR